MTLEKLLQRTKKGVAIAAIVGMSGLSGCATNGYSVGPQVDLQGRSAGLYVSNTSEPTNDVGYNNSEEGWSTTQKFLLGAAVVGAGVLIYSATKPKKSSASTTPAATTNTSCPAGFSWNGTQCVG